MVVPNSTATVPPLTPKLLEAAKPRERDYEIADGVARGLRVRITPTGARVFRWHVTSENKVITIGRWSKAPRPGFVTLAEARQRLEELKVAHAAGRLADVEAKYRSRPAGAPGADGAPTVKSLAADFMKLMERRRRRPEQMGMLLRVHVVPAIGDMPVAIVTTRDCRRIVEAMVAAKHPTQAGHVLAALKQLFRFAQGRDDVPSNPAAALDPESLGVVNRVCQRVLSDKELVAFWRALDAYRGMSPTVRNGLKLLALLGVRSGELLQAGWTEIDFDTATWTIPPEHRKMTLTRLRTSRPWKVPLPPTSLRLLEDLRALAKSLDSRYVLASFSPSAPGAPLSEKALIAGMRKLFVGAKPLLKFDGERPTPHDLRRGVRSGLSQLGVPWHVAEAAVGHSLGAITNTYDTSDMYLAERRDALTRWDSYVQRLLDPSASNVVELKAGGR